jgi:hypothetical protein
MGSEPAGDGESIRTTTHRNTCGLQVASQVRLGADDRSQRARARHDRRVAAHADHPRHDDDDDNDDDDEYPLIDDQPTGPPDTPAPRGAELPGLSNGNFVRLTCS